MQSLDSINDLCLLPVCLVPFGGLCEVDVRPGEVVIIGPATGRYGGAAVSVALAMGAIVIATGRNKDALKNLEKIHDTTRLKTVQLTGHSETDTESFRAAIDKPDGADVYLDISPPAAQGSSLTASGIRALRAFGRCIIMGGNSGNVDFPYLEIMFKSIRIQGRFMYDRQHVQRLIQMAESGLLPLGKNAGVTQTEVFGLEQVEEALEAASKLSGWGGHVVLKP